MEVHVVVTANDLDEKTVNIVEQKVVAEQTQDTNTVQFTEQLKEVEISQISHLVFSEINQDKNSSNKIVVCTGWKIGDKYYGDRPDDGKYINPFTGEELTKGEPILEPDNSKVSLVQDEISNGTVLGTGNEKHHASYSYRVTNKDAVPADLTLTLTIANGTLTESTKHQVLGVGADQQFELQGTAKYPSATTLTATLTRNVNGSDVVISTLTADLTEGLD